LAETAEQSDRAVPVAPNRWWLKACVVMLVVACLIGMLVAVAAVGGLWWRARSTRTSLEVDLSYPARVNRGDSLVVTMTLHNVEDMPLELDSISIDGSLELNFLEGLELAETDPPYRSHEERATETHFYSFDTTLEPGEEHQIKLRFRALQPGDFQGMVFVDVIEEGGRLLHTPPSRIDVVVLP